MYGVIALQLCKSCLDTCLTSTVVDLVSYGWASTVWRVAYFQGNYVLLKITTRTKNGGSIFAAL